VAKPTNGSTETTQTNINTCITTACTTEKILLKHGKKQFTCTMSSGVVANIYLAECMASAEREPITGVWGQTDRAPSGVQGQSPWCGVRRAKPP